MLWKTSSPVLETRWCDSGGGKSTDTYKATKSWRASSGVGGVHSTDRGQGTTKPGLREGTLLCSSNQRVEGEGIAGMLTTPENIRTLQRKLYHKAKQEKAYRFYALYDKIYLADILGHAYNLVQANKGSAGIDGVTFEDIETEEGITAFLAELEDALRNKTYRPDPVKRVMISKANGEKRPLGIPTIRDRVAQMAVKLIIEPIFEADFCRTSYGFRPGKSAHDAIDEVTYALHRGHTEVIDADLSKYFDTIPHANLLAVVAERISDGEILRLIKLWLKAPVMEEEKETAKARRKAESLVHYCRIYTCTCWTGYGSGINWKGNSGQESYAMRTT